MGARGAVAGAVFGGAIGEGIMWYEKLVANANVLVRPELANVSIFNAYWAGHAKDWIIYNYPGQTTAAAVIALGGLAALIGYAYDS